MMEPVKRKYRLGLLGFLNALPLVHRFRDREEVEAVWDTPRPLTEMLKRGELDAAITSSYAYAAKLRSVISDLCIACEGRVVTVMLYANCTLDEIQTVEEDPASLTSNALTRIIFDERKQRVHFTPTLNYSTPLPANTARVLIGDANFHPPMPYEQVFDLAAVIWELYRLPCVFALWQGKAGVDGKLVKLIENAFAEVEENWDSLYAFAEKEWDVPPPAIRDYFQNVLHYRLTDKDREFLDFFRKKVHDLGLVW